MVPVADTASLEHEREQMKTELNRVIEFFCKPPFTRKVKEVSIVDAASLEIKDPSTAAVENR